MRRAATASSPSYALLSMGEAPLHRTAFDQRAGRAGGAFGAALAAHALLLLAVWGLARVAPGLSTAAQATASSIAPFIFTSSADDGRGRSGGGDRSAKPASLVRTRGADARAIPAISPQSMATPDTIVPEREPAPSLPMMPMNAGDIPQVGAVDGVPGPPTDERGPGDSGVGTRPGSDRGLGDGPGPGIGDGPYGVGNGVTAPTLIHRTPPQYSAEAMRAKVQGVAVLSGVVGVDGTLHDIRVVRSLDAAFGLDREAIACVRQWRFRPGTRQGKPVAVHVTIEVAFNLR